MTVASRDGLRPEIRRFLEDQDALDLPAVWEVSLAELRAGMVASSQQRWGSIDELSSVEALSVPTRTGAIGARAYLPSRESGGTFVYIHGGGWVVGDLDSHEGLCRALARRLGCVVIALDYRRAPEHRFPAAVHDCVDAVAWVGGRGAEILGVDPHRLAIGGDSAGANLAAVVARHRAIGGSALAAQVLIYPACDTDTTLPSFHEYATGFDLTTEAVRWFYAQYLPDDERGQDPDRAPVHGDLEGVAPAYVATAECDPVRDDGRAYVAQLRRAGVDVEHEEWVGTVHGFALMRAVTPATDQLIDRVVSFVARRWEE